MSQFTSADCHSVLKRYWGYDSFRPLQEDIIMSVLDGNDTLGLLPTGGGKSLTFQVPAMLLPGLTLVVTPLISLMKDQVDNLGDRGIRAVYLFSGMQRKDSRLALERCRLGKVKLAYVSPERLQSRRFVDELCQMDVSLIVVDEAHCISQWGYDFRPSYLKIAEVRKIFPSAPVLALTASATERVVDDIMNRLDFRRGNKFAKSFARTNLSYVVRYGDNKEQMLLRVLNGTIGTAIVYVRSRRKTREIATFLSAQGIQADFYHAGLDSREKEERQNAWKEGRTRVIVATNAFGMGIDKPDVRVVVHLEPPPSLEEYYQEAGRAGRDGLPSYAVLLVSKTDKALLTRRINESFPDEDYIRHVYEMAGNFLEVAVGDGFEKVYEFNFKLFCFRFNLKPVPTESALKLLTRAGYIEYVEETTSRSRITILITKRELYDLPLDPVTDRVFQYILRHYTGLFTDYVYINESLIAVDLKITEQQVYDSLLFLARLHAVHYVPRQTTPYIVYTTSREEPRYVQMPLAVYADQRRNMEQRIRAVQEFAYSTDKCRSQILLEYFGEKNPPECGSCDICRAKRSRRNDSTKETSLEQSILYLAARNSTVEYICTQLYPTARKRIISTIRSMVDEGLLRLEGSKVISNR